MVRIAFLFTSIAFTSFCSKQANIDSTTPPALYFQENSINYYGDTAFYRYQEEIQDTTAILNWAVEFCKKNPDFGLTIVGHSDMDEEVGQDTMLSFNRAEKVKKHLVNTGIKKSLLDIKAKGSNNPKISNKDINSLETQEEKEYARIFNRRVTFYVIKAK